MLKGRHRRRWVEQNSNEIHLAWAVKPVHIWYVVHIFEKAITRSDKIKLWKIANISSAIVCSEIIITDTVRSVTGYAQAFEKKLRGENRWKGRFRDRWRYGAVERFNYKLKALLCVLYWCF